MEHRSLILLGLLMGQSQHGYQINEFIEKNLSTMTNMKKPTAYATLDKLSLNGYIDVQTEKEGNRPPRKVYSINDRGREYFFQLLLSNLASAENVNYQGDIGLMFIDFLPTNQALTPLENRLEENKKQLAVFKKTPTHGIRSGVNLVVAHKISMLKAEILFLEQTIETLQSEVKYE